MGPAGLGRRSAVATPLAARPQPLAAVGRLTRDRARPTAPASPIRAVATPATNGSGTSTGTPSSVPASGSSVIRARAARTTSTRSSTPPRSPCPTASASSPSLGLESGQNYMHGCFDKTMDLALARNFRLGRQAQHPVPDRGVQRVQRRGLQRPRKTLQVDESAGADPSATRSTTRRATWLQTRLTPQNAGFGAATRAQNMRSMQAQIRFQF